MKEEIISVLEELGILDMRLTTKELLSRCKVSRTVFNERKLHKHPLIKKNRYKVGKNYVYKLEAVKVLNELLEKGIMWDEQNNREI